MIRFVVTCLFVLLFLVGSIPLLIAEWIIGKFNMDVKSRSSLAIVSWAFRCVLFLCGVKLTVIGEENVPKDTPVLYIGNHCSYFDIIMTYVRVPRLTGYIAKTEMKKIPLLSHWMKNLHCLFLDRKDIKQGLKTILTAIDKMKNGISICIFPEGTRNRNPEVFMPFHDGSFKVAEKSKCPIVPMAINNSADIYEAHTPFIKSTHVVLEYGKPFYVTDLSAEERKCIGDTAASIVRQMYDKNKSLV